MCLQQCGGRHTENSVIWRSVSTDNHRCQETNNILLPKLCQAFHESVSRMPAYQHLLEYASRIYMRIQSCFTGEICCSRLFLNIILAEYLALLGAEISSSLWHTSVFTFSVFVWPYLLLKWRDFTEPKQPSYAKRVSELLSHHTMRGMEHLGFEVIYRQLLLQLLTSRLPSTDPLVCYLQDEQPEKCTIPMLQRWLTGWRACHKSTRTWVRIPGVHVWEPITLTLGRQRLEDTWLLASQSRSFSEV